MPYFVYQLSCRWVQWCLNEPAVNVRLPCLGYMFPFEEDKSQRVGKLCHISGGWFYIIYLFSKIAAPIHSLPTVFSSSYCSLGPQVYAMITLVFSSHVTNFHTLSCFKKTFIYQFTVMLARSSVAESFIRDTQNK